MGTRFPGIGLGDLWETAARGQTVFDAVKGAAIWIATAAVPAWLWAKRVIGWDHAVGAFALLVAVLYVVTYRRKSKEWWEAWRGEKVKVKDAEDLLRLAGDGEEGQKDLEEVMRELTNAIARTKGGQENPRGTPDDLYREVLGSIGGTLSLFSHSIYFHRLAPPDADTPCDPMDDDDFRRFSRQVWRFRSSLQAVEVMIREQITAFHNAEALARVQRQP